MQIQNVCDDDSDIFGINLINRIVVAYIAEVFTPLRLIQTYTYSHLEVIFIPLP